jgi:hypothetical protein
MGQAVTRGTTTAMAAGGELGPRTTMMDDAGLDRGRMMALLDVVVLQAPEAEQAMAEEAVAAVLVAAAVADGVAVTGRRQGGKESRSRVGRRRRRLGAGRRPARPRTRQDLMHAGAEVTAHNLNRSERWPTLPLTHHH